MEMIFSSEKISQLGFSPEFSSKNIMKRAFDLLRHIFMPTFVSINAGHKF